MGVAEELWREFHPGVPEQFLPGFGPASAAMQAEEIFCVACLGFSCIGPELKCSDISENH
jgi:hypothetical protein